MDQASVFLAEGVETAKGAAEGLSYLTGIGVDSETQEAAVRGSVQDLSRGNAGSRALGALDSFVGDLTFGLIDPGLSRMATNREAAQAGRAYGTGGVLAVAAVSGRGLLRQGTRALGNLASAGAVPKPLFGSGVS